ncbi:MAG TPA: nuclear transport factor 2 family protein [Hyphomonadaceae bacterium]|jgi:ketosteroid isomerase-like protein|nr:nuclear transport factor 2 family protein [Hyphomonadaceae bacterium]
MTADSPQACAADFTAALIRRDMGAALALLTDDVVFFYSNGTTIVGKDAFAALMTASWKVIENYQYKSGDSQWIAGTANAATVIYSFAWSGIARGAEVSGSGRGTRVFSRQSGGEWLIAHEHLSNGAWKP